MSDWYVLLVALGVGAVCAEYLVRRARGRPMDLQEARVSLSVGSISYLVGLCTQLGFVAVSFVLATRVAVWHLSASNPLIWIAFFVIDDFVNYVVHRAEHRVAFLWAAHVVHHSTEDLSFTAALRLSPVEALYQPLLVLWAPLCGFPLVIYAPLTVVALVIGQLQHTQLVGRLPRLDSWLATPSNHRVHHGSNPQYLNKNFGSSLMIWDHLFGTYEPEVEVAVFGVANFHKEGVLETMAGTYPELLSVRRERARRPRGRECSERHRRHRRDAVVRARARRPVDRAMRQGRGVGSGGRGRVPHEVGR